MKNIYLAIFLLYCGFNCKGQNKPVTFGGGYYTDSLFPAEPQWWAFQHKALNDTIDYRGRRIAKETIFGEERNYDSLGRLVKHISRNSLEYQKVRSWEYFPEKTIYSDTTFWTDGTFARSEIWAPDQKVVERPVAKKKTSELSMSRMVDGEWKVCYSAKYDSTGKLLSQYENTNVLPNAYLGGVLLTNYFYDDADRCIGFRTTNDTGEYITGLRCRYNASGQIEVWDMGQSPMFFKTYDSLVYDDSGNVTYVYHQSGLEQAKEYLFEYDKYGKVTRCVEKINGGEIMTEHIYIRENGLLLEAITKQYQFGTITTTSSVRKYEFRK